MYYTGIYDACLYTWKVFKSKDEWYSRMETGMTLRFLRYVNGIVTSNWFEYTVCLVILANGVILVAQTSVISYDDQTATEKIYLPWVSYFFIGRRFTKKMNSPMWKKVSGARS